VKKEKVSDQLGSMKKEEVPGDETLIGQVDKQIKNAENRARKKENKRIKKEALQNLAGEKETQSGMEIKVEDPAA